MRDILQPPNWCPAKPRSAERLGIQQGSPDEWTGIGRGRGVDRTGLTDLMRAAGLTHGAFYRHFKSKDELVAQIAQFR
jgi:AcrR family transcriptional regulator